MSALRTVSFCTVSFRSVSFRSTVHLVLPVLLTLGAGLAPAQARAACEQQVPASELARKLSEADAAFQALDEPAFRTAVAQARVQIRCLSEPLSPTQAASYHKIEAFSAFLDREHAATVQSFRAMLAASPGYRLSELVAPEGHPLRTDFEIAQGLPPVPGRDLPVPVEGVVRIDGREAAEAPSSLPFVVQRVGEDGAVFSTDLVEVGASLPTWETRPVRGGDDASAGLRSPRRLTAPLAATAVVAGVTSAALYGVSTSRSNQFWDPTTPTDDLDGLRRQANGTAYGAVGAGVVAVGAGAAALVTFAW